MILITNLGKIMVKTQNMMTKIIMVSMMLAMLSFKIITEMALFLSHMNLSMQVIMYGIQRNLIMMRMIMANMI